MTQEDKLDNAGNAIVKMFAERLRDNLGNRLTPELSNGLLSVLGSGLKEAFDFVKGSDPASAAQVDSASESQ